MIQPLTERGIARLLMADRWMKHLCVPCYTPADWWENDMFMISKSGYWSEFEIKLSLADFRRDSDKVRDLPNTGRLEADGTGVQRWTYDREKKHELLAGNDRGPACFYYVAPVGVIPLDELPNWAGLIEVDLHPPHIYERLVVKAPRRHGRKADGMRTAVLETCYWRFHRGVAWD